MTFYVFVRLEGVEDFVKWTKNTNEEPPALLKNKVRVCFPRYNGFTMLGVDEDLWFKIREIFDNSEKCN